MRGLTKGLSRLAADSMAQDAFHSHFGPSTSLLSPETISSATDGKWKQVKKPLAGIGKVVEYLPEGAQPITGPAPKAKVSKFSVLSCTFESLADLPVFLLQMIASVLEQFEARPSSSSSSSDALQSSVLSVIGGYQDLYLSRLEIEERERVRDVALLHSVNHVLK